MMEHDLTILWIILAVVSVLLLRPVVLWYYKITDVIKNFENILAELKKLNNKMEEERK